MYSFYVVLYSEVPCKIILFKNDGIDKKILEKHWSSSAALCSRWGKETKRHETFSKSDTG